MSRSGAGNEQASFIPKASSIDQQIGLLSLPQESHWRPTSNTLSISASQVVPLNLAFVSRSIQTVKFITKCREFCGRSMKSPKTRLRQGQIWTKPVRHTYERS